MPKIVLAEDDQTMVNLLSTLLRMDGFDVVGLDPIEDVAAAVQREAPDFLVLDVLLTNQNGLEILDTIRGRAEGGRGPRIVMISGLNVRDECLRRGADEFLMKPFMPEELINLLRGSTPPS